MALFDVIWEAYQGLTGNNEPIGIFLQPMTGDAGLQIPFSWWWWGELNLLL
jgi:hypothetical protein